jgi:hypothetical protein
MNWKQIFIAVTLSSLFGMLLGGLFGFGAGKLTPDFFLRLIPWRDVEPVGLATFFGATAGVLLGGALGCFGVLVQSYIQLRNRKDNEAGAT